MAATAAPPDPDFRDTCAGELLALGCACGLGLLLAAALGLLLFAPRVRAAPVPPDPPLAEAVLCGRWDYQWGDQRGHIWLLRDGTYTSRLRPDGPMYAGRWWCHRGRLVLVESWYDPDTGRAGENAARYEVEFPRGLPGPGRCCGDTVRLSGRVPIDGDD